MTFPNYLFSKNRKTYPENKIHLKNYMFARHKPGYDWLEGDEYPDFSKLRSNQSFNWSAFSIPIWTKFNDQKIFQIDYGVVGYSVRTIRHVNIYDSDLPIESYGLRHKPLECNYSHCEIYNNNFTKVERRKFRLLLRNGCKVLIKPYSEQTLIIKMYHYLIMFMHRILMKTI